MLGHALVHAAKARSFDALVRDRVSIPLGLPDTAEALTGGQLARQALGYGDEFDPCPAWDFASLEACGALRSTAPDLLTFAAAAMGDTPAPAVRDSLIRQRRGASSLDAVGLFWGLADLPTSLTTTTPVANHTGQVGGHTAIVWVQPADKLAVVVLSTDADAEAAGRVEGLAAAVARAVGRGR